MQLGIKLSGPAIRNASMCTMRIASYRGLYADESSALVAANAFWQKRTIDAACSVSSEDV
jgi:hypothetical protein